jgi:hypothetical protein
VLISSSFTVLGASCNNGEVRFYCTRLEKYAGCENDTGICNCETGYRFSNDNTRCEKGHFTFYYKSYMFYLRLFVNAFRKLFASVADIQNH